ncbi:magnesium protoporphyrin IX methyltransferase [Acaryochloris sp. CCMEE 5410]|uniref:magnesium protoporphyrin IX methyltransferase n=1 Tax=Acaryochloris sp. CCMEE 5410 TaxID=310037 RepID=UPI0002484561|nr:magnesium protoporphyrin IX methyltransferase [Acaryochloris sp. CCMEE 5410]KAI9135288.1 magnesium protoporphyrin IX methyltransferase [Acaryochloris sp. CCMEE 5410]
MPTTNDKAVVQDYFNTVGFDRWRRIYGDGDVNKVQKDIRIGHQQTVDTVISWLKADGDLSGQSFCDAGCGVGSLSIPLATMGIQVSASDISKKMVEEAQSRAQQTLGQDQNPSFSVQDLETLSGSYDTVICLDVLIHYPDQKVPEMINHLASLAQSRIILSFAPWTIGYMLLKKIGSFFPGPSKTTRAYLHRDFDICDILRSQGWTIERKAMTKTSFYFSRIIEAKRPEA